MISQIRLNTQSINLKLPGKHIDRISYAANLNAKSTMQYPNIQGYDNVQFITSLALNAGSVKRVST